MYGYVLSCLALIRRMPVVLPLMFFYFLKAVGKDKYSKKCYLVTILLGADAMRVVINEKPKSEYKEL